MPYNFPMGNIYGTRTIKGEKIIACYTAASVFIPNSVAYYEL